MRRKGFTLIEMLVVIAVIAIVLTIVVAIGSGVKSGANRRATLAELKTLEGIMSDYLAAGNPEPTPPASWPYTADKTPEVWSETNPPSDPTNWVLALKSFPETAKKLASLQTGTDTDWHKASAASARQVVLDSFGNAIRYIPSTTAKQGYFMSAGPDGRFSMTVNLIPTPPPEPDPVASLRADELFSTDPQ